MPKKGGSDISITPCYEGRTLKGVHQVAGDGLSLISIKVSHHNCKFTPDPNTKKPLISCAHGIKARNSFWNLHKPDLCKVKGLQCATTESVTQLFQAHNVENAGKPSYKKKVLRLLGSLVTKKPKLSDQPESLSNNCSRPVDKCVLSSVYQEKEMDEHKIIMQEDLHFNDPQETTENQPKSVYNNQLLNNSFKTSSEEFMETVYIPLPCSSNMIAHYCDNAFLNTQIKIQETKNILKNSETSKTYSYDASSSQKCPSSFELVGKKSLSHIAAYSHLDRFTTKPSHEERSSTRSSMEKRSSISQTNLSQKVSTKLLMNSSEVLVQSIFSEMFKEMQEIEDYISSYIGSFCVLEEEFDNYPALNRMPSVVSHFLDQVHSPTKLKPQQDKSNSSNTADVQTYTNQLATIKTAPGFTIGSINTFHSYPEKEENSYIFAEETVPNVKFPGLEESNTVRQSFDILLEDASVTQGNSDQGTTPGYCYWDDIEGTEPLEDLTLNHSGIESNNTSLISSSSIVPAQFFVNIWKDFITNIENMDFGALIDSQSFPLDENIAFYGHWAGIFDQSIMEEAQNIVSSVDTFLDCQVFPSENFNHDVRVPCSIVEIDNADENVFLKEGSVCSDLNALVNKQENSDILYGFPQEECTQTNVKEDTIVSPVRLSINIGSDPGIALLMDLEDAAIRTENNVPSLSEINEILASIKKSLDEISNQYVSTSDYAYACQSDLSSDIHILSSTSETHKNAINNQNEQDKISRDSITDGKEKEFPEIDLEREISKISMNILQENKMAFSKSQDEESRFVNISETCDGNSSKTRSNLLFSSPKMQLNLTNPLRNINKK